MNTSDRFVPEVQSVSGCIAAAGVLVTAFLAFVTGLVVFGPALVYRLTGTNLGF